MDHPFLMPKMCRTCLPITPITAPMKVAPPTIQARHSRRDFTSDRSSPTSFLMSSSDCASRLTRSPTVSPTLFPLTTFLVPEHNEQPPDEGGKPRASHDQSTPIEFAHLSILRPPRVAGCRVRSKA